MKKLSTIARLVFYAIAALTILEYMTICGMFTGPLMMVLSVLAGLFNAALSLKGRHYNEALLYLVASAALSMGYWKLMLV